MVIIFRGKKHTFIVFKSKVVLVIILRCIYTLFPLAVHFFSLLLSFSGVSVPGRAAYITQLHTFWRGWLAQRLSACCGSGSRGAAFTHCELFSQTAHTLRSSQEAGWVRVMILFKISIYIVYVLGLYVYFRLYSFIICICVQVSR